MAKRKKNFYESLEVVADNFKVNKAFKKKPKEESKDGFHYTTKESRLIYTFIKDNNRFVTTHEFSLKELEAMIRDVKKRRKSLGKKGTRLLANLSPDLTIIVDG